jgi:cyclophilin family peptidyl-prolyl cis-trans isomerase/HEAT repeat protein
MKKVKKMKKILTICFVVLICFSVQSFGQITDEKNQKPIEIILDKQVLKNTFIRIAKAEDELRFDETLQNILEKGNPFERERAALAAGRIGDEDAIPLLAKLLENDVSAKVRETAAFALGEIESIKAADAVLKILENKGFPDDIRSRVVEAAGKIAAANAKDEKAKELSEAILDALEYENGRGEKQSKEVILLGITAALRAKPEEADYVLAKFLTNLDSRVRADAANALARLRAKNANEKFRAMLLTDDDPIARANAARALGASEDAEAVNMLTEAATTDNDLRVRVNAIRSLGSLKAEKSADKLLEQGEKLLADYQKSKFANPIEKNELLEIATALGRILEKTKNEKALKFLDDFIKLDKLRSSEIPTARIKISQSKFQPLFSDGLFDKNSDWRTARTLVQLIGEVSNFDDIQNKNKLKKETEEFARNALKEFIEKRLNEKSVLMTLPDLLTSFAKFKTDDLDTILREYLEHKDIFIRTTAAQLLGEQKSTEENINALQDAFAKSLETDRDYNDAQLAILSALVKLNKTRALGQLTTALDHYDILLRRHAADLIKQNGLDEGFPKIPNAEEKVGTVKPYDKKNKSKLGQILNNEKDYNRAVSRENGKVQAILTTEKGKITIELLPDDAPLTVDNFIKLARSKYFNNVAIHRVVPNFVVQDGDPLGNGSGGPGWQIRDEMNTIPYERGVVGMALSGPNTGGSQWFVTHSPQPHLDGGYTVFGRVNETDMKIVDMLVRGDKILKVEIVEKK